MHSAAGFDLSRISDAALRPIGEKVMSGTRLDDADAVVMFKSPDLLGLGALASHANAARHGDVVTFAANQHINPTNVCYLRKTCVFCSFARLPKEEGAYRYTLEQVIDEASAAGQRTHARIPHRRRPRHARRPGLLQRDVPRAQGAASAGSHQGAHRGRDRAHRAHREDVDRRGADCAARSRTRYAAWWRSRSVRPWRENGDRRQEAGCRGLDRGTSHRPSPGHQVELHDALRSRRDHRGSRRASRHASLSPGRDRRLPRLHSARLSPRQQRARHRARPAGNRDQPGSTTCAISPSVASSSTTSSTSRRTGSW